MQPFRLTVVIFLAVVIRSANACLQNGDAGWSSPVARQAHNLKVAGSNPAPATKGKYSRMPSSGSFFVLEQFQQKCEAVLRSELRQNKELEQFRGSEKSGNL